MYLRPPNLTGHQPCPSRCWMLNLADPLVQVRVTSATCSSVAIVSTLYRLFIRRKKLWVDDVTAFISMLVLMVQMIGVFVIPRSAPYNDRAWYYMVAVTFFCALWSARLSILLSLIRINPFPGQRSKLKIIAIIFPVVPLLLILQCILTCIPEHHWNTEDTIPVCSLNDANAICQLIGPYIAVQYVSLSLRNVHQFKKPTADVLADGVLLYVPTRLLMILSDKTLRTRLILIFSTCIITSLVGLAHVVETFKSEYGARIYTAIIENNIALIVCNTPIILTSIIDLKESPWEERLTGRFILDLRNLDLETMSPQIPNHTTTQDTNTNSHNSFQATSTTTNHNRNSRIIVLPPLSFPEPVALFSKSADESCNQSPISS
ncbi:hypothetical protein AGABI2DRAFT_123411 [Agaricus bisporus var. bisporus H97]|uniref:hypothetical protein n=1 Tax=Agaricus bisporus var. bisporus (strain H97 / ATCC MYA-4626 / FGSC 10389) TaxID=936046 RepID=UPI00029F7976|nr:hypothetical protein AGABI2DRAFT_123411 [Agaricus bisporus var. bisporus H97]EKV41692.1 hypothetical protein AGABI2DRAFT_123411 [Agaricus bisporus var. bisporus H97]